MAKSELGTKRVCPETGRKFYDLGKTPVISPYTGKVVPIIVPVQSRSRPSDAAAAAAKAAPAAEVESIVPETADAEFVSLEDAEAEQQGKKSEAGAGDEDEVEADETLDDAAFIEEQDEGDPDVTDIIGDGIEKEEEQ